MNQLKKTLCSVTIKDYFRDRIKLFCAIYTNYFQAFTFFDKQRQT